MEGEEFQGVRNPFASEKPFLGNFMAFLSLLEGCPFAPAPVCNSVIF